MRRNRPWAGMRSTWASSVIAAIISAGSAHALDSSITARSSLSPDELWDKVGNFCAISAWDPVVERCELAADGKQRTIVIIGGVGRVVSELENRDDANRSYAWRNVSGLGGLVPVNNYRGTISVIADGQGSALKWTASYEAKGISDTEAQKIIDDAIRRALCFNSPLICTDDRRLFAPAEVVGFQALSLSPKPLTLRGYLRRPDGVGPFPAVVLLHGCDGSPEPLDQLWGTRIAGWGYATLTIDRFGPRGLKNTCLPGRAPKDMAFDAYQALNFLAQQPFIDAMRIAAVGFSQGGWLSLSSVERGTVEQVSRNKFRAAAAFYPPCLAVQGPMTVPTLILIGENDDWTPAEACRKLVAGEDDLGVSRQKAGGTPMQLVVYPDAYHAFDLPSLQTPVTYFGHHVEFNKRASEQSSDALREFLRSMVQDR
jgi:dienelactone hydrolase